MQVDQLLRLGRSKPAFILQVQELAAPPVGFVPIRGDGEKITEPVKVGVAFRKVFHLHERHATPPYIAEQVEKPPLQLRREIVEPENFGIESPVEELEPLRLSLAYPLLLLTLE